MEAKEPAPRTIDEYLAALEPPARGVLRKVRAAARRGAPEATEVISYRMPALRGRGILVYFAAHTHHVGLYPPVAGDARLEKAVAPYANEKGNLRFPYDEPIPYDLIEELVRLRAKQDAERAGARRKKA
jgi:uncharacterized protein YdhG (YjbR/CyaY superfamily)